MRLGTTSGTPPTAVETTGTPTLTPLRSAAGSPSRSRADPRRRRPRCAASHRAFGGREKRTREAPSEAAGAKLVVVGDGPERADSSAWRQPPRALHGCAFSASNADETLRIVAGADAGLLSSDWENLPHSAVEALSVGVPVVSTAVGGVPEVVRDGENGLLVPPGDPDVLAAALRRILDEPGLRDRLAAAAKPSVEALSSDIVYGKLEALLSEAVR